MTRRLMRVCPQVWVAFHVVDDDTNDHYETFRCDTEYLEIPDGWQFLGVWGEEPSPSRLYEALAVVTGASL